MAGVIVAAEVKPSTFLSSEGIDESPTVKESQCQTSKALCDPKTSIATAGSQHNIVNEQSGNGQEGKNKSGLTLNTEVTQSMLQETKVSQCTKIGEDFVKCVESHSNESQAEREKAGSSGDLLSGANIHEKEEYPKDKEGVGKETDFLEDMKIFDASAASAGQPRGPMEWILRQIAQDTDPRDIISQLMPGAFVPSHIDDITLWKGVWELITEPKARKKLETVNTIEDVVRLIESSKNVIVLTGAGVSVSCGIPDFRSRDGIYARLSKDFPDLPDPQSMFDIHYFRRNQRPFFKFAKEIYPGQFKPSLSHRFIAALDKRSKLLRNYTQNIDTLEQVAGIKRVIQCHGSFATASCTKCKYQVEAEAIREDIFNQVVPKCPICPQDESTLAVMKPDIIFFGEGLPDAFYHNLDTDKHEADLLIVIGSSLKVRPVALIPDYLKPGVPQILINREPLYHFNFDVELLGNCDTVIHELCRRLGDDWANITEDHDMPHLDKEVIEKMFDSASEADSDLSVDGVEADTKKEQDTEAGSAIATCNTSTGVQSDEVSDSVFINVGHISCENAGEKCNDETASGECKDNCAACDPTEGTTECKEKEAITLSQGGKETQQVVAIDGESRTGVGENSHDAPGHNSKSSVENKHKNFDSKIRPVAATQPRDAPKGSTHNPSQAHPQSPLNSYSHNPTAVHSHDAVVTQPKNPLIDESHDTLTTQPHSLLTTESHNSQATQSHNALTTQPHNSPTAQSHNALTTQPHHSPTAQSDSLLTTQSHDPLNMHPCNPSTTKSQDLLSNESHDPVSGPSQDAPGYSTDPENDDTKRFSRKRIIDEVYKICADCEKRKVHERSEFSSEARLAQNISSDMCRCGDEVKRRKVDSPNGTGLTEGERRESSSSSLCERNAESSKRKSSIERNSKVKITANSPSLDKNSLIERFNYEDIYYLHVPPNRYIFDGTEVNRSVKYRFGSVVGSSDDENCCEDKTNTITIKKPWEAETEQPVD